MSSVLNGPGGAEAAPGFYGKVPDKGDFVSRRLPRSVIAPWDRWLQDAIAASRERMGEDWLPAYLTSPVWRFALSAGLCGDAVLAGVLIPSVDRVGRYFPLAIAAPLPGSGSALLLPLRAGRWFDGLEDLALSALDEDFDFDRFDEGVRQAGLPEALRGTVGAPVRESSAGLGWRVTIGPEGDPLVGCAALLDHLVAFSTPDYSLWWTSGSDSVDGTLVVARGLPEPSAFAALLDGAWTRWGWEGPVMADLLSEPETPVAAEPELAPPVEPAVAGAAESEAASEPESRPMAGQP